MVVQRGTGYSIQELADRFSISRKTIANYIALGVLPPPSPPRGPSAAYDNRHVERLEAIWGHNGLKDQTVRLKDLADRPWHPNKGWFQA